MTEFKKFSAYYKEKFSRESNGGVISGMELDIFIIKLFKEFTDDIEWIIDNCQEIKTKIMNIREFKNEKIEEYLIYQMMLEYTKINKKFADGFQRKISVGIGEMNAVIKKKREKREKSGNRKGKNVNINVNENEIKIENGSVFGKSFSNYRNMDVLMRPVEDKNPFGREEEINMKKRKMI